MPLHPEIEHYRTEIKRLQTEMAVKAKEIFTRDTAVLFEKYPDLQTFGWRQYTPYFNDGDPCYFRASIDEYSVLINGVNLDGDDEGVMTDEDRVVAKEVSNFLYTIGNENLEEIFGDHVVVTVKRNGDVITDDYEHR